MAYIISKKDGPRREDVAAKRLIAENQSTIKALADQFSGGTYSAGRQPPKPPEASGAVFHFLAGLKTAEAERLPYIRISLNGRVVVVDGDTSKQLSFLGVIRQRHEHQEFVLATRQNEFYPPMSDELHEQLKEFDHQIINDDFSEEDLAEKIGNCLGLL